MIAGLAGIVRLAARDETAKPTEAEVAALFLPTKHFSLSCMYAQLVIDLYLCGIFTMMVANYITHQWKRDAIATKAVVLAAAFMCFVCSGYLTWFISYLFVDNFGLYSEFLETTYLSWFPLLDSITSGIIQLFFAYRAYRLMNRNILILIVLIVSVADRALSAFFLAAHPPTDVQLLIITSFAATVAVKVIFAGLNSELEASKVSVLWLSCIMSADIIITISILWGLLRTKTGWAHTDKIITRLIRMTFESQVPPTILAIIFVAEFVATPSSLFGATLQGIQSKFYGIGLMYSLNSRINFAVVQNVTMDNTAGGEVFALSHKPVATIQVDVETETYVHQGGQAYPAVGLNRRTFEDWEVEGDNDQKSAYESQARLTRDDSGDHV